jgi:hypothetical protein
MEKRPFSIFDFIFQEIISISRNTLHSIGYALQIMFMIEKIIEGDRRGVNESQIKFFSRIGLCSKIKTPDNLCARM